MFTLKIETMNAAFAEDPGAELARILRGIADRARDLGPPLGDRGAIHDANGNTVGTWRYIHEEDAA